MKFEDQYYLMFRQPHWEYPSIIPKGDTVDRPYYSDRLLPGKPLFFEIDDLEALKKDGIEVESHPLYVSAGGILAVDGVREYFTNYFNLTGMQFYPSVIVGDEGKWHEDYWYLNIYSEIDCWDREKSKITGSLDSIFDVDEYVFDQSVLDNIPEDERLIFRMGGAQNLHLLFHQRVIDYLEEAQVTGWRAFKVSEYEFKMQF